MSERTVSEILGADFVSPWFGITFVKFYRPVATFILGIEFLMFGVHPLPYTVLHLLVHGLNACLVYLLVRRLLATDRWQEPFLAALLFALYPLHCNSILHIASFSNLYGATFILSSLVFFAASRLNHGRKAYLGSILCFALALGCYEQAVILPALLLGCDLILPLAPERRTIKARLKVFWPYVVMLAAYFGVRFLVLGEFIGGYAGIDTSLEQWKRALANLMYSFYKMINPSWEGGEFMPHLGMVGVAVTVAMGICLWLRVSGREVYFSVLMLFALVWIAICQAPFQFCGVVPANGRYWYLAEVGLAFGIMGVSVMVATLLRVRTSMVSVPITVALLLFWLPLLAANIDRHRRAGEITRSIQKSVVEAAQGESPQCRVFLSGYPMFIRTPMGAQVAQVFHWGLRDAMGPPFLSHNFAVFSLPQSDRMGLLPVAKGVRDGQILTWTKQWGTVPFDVTPEDEISLAQLREIQILAPKEGAQLWVDGSPNQATVEAPGYPNLTLITAGPCKSSKKAVKIHQTKGTPVKIAFPTGLIEVQRQLYGDEVIWWVEARDNKGKLRAVSPLRRIVKGTFRNSL
ncbi:MAG: glucosyltransferase domain-containing protein [Deltaproteobacteria bacterium]|nr:glucosyltransferase domain-containing protein [Deltaproteobacteria bacterium]